MADYTSEQVQDFMVGALDNYLDSDRFNSARYYDATVDQNTLTVLKDTVREALADASEHATVKDYLDSYDEYGNSSENLFQEAPAGMILSLIADTSELSMSPFRSPKKFQNFDEAMEEALHTYIYGGARAFLKEAWEREFSKVTYSYIV